MSYSQRKEKVIKREVVRRKKDGNVAVCWGLIVVADIAVDRPSRVVAGLLLWWEGGEIVVPEMKDEGSSSSSNSRF